MSRKCCSIRGGHSRSGADEAGLVGTVDRAKICELSGGHPLAARYLIEALKSAASEAARQLILDGKFEYAGDIQRVYDSAFRDIETDEEVRKVLAYLARVEGTISPEFLSSLVSISAIERTHKAVGHLLVAESRRWRVFHNSFRLYLLSKEQHPLGWKGDEQGSRLYADLAKIVRDAPINDPQHWLELRYRARAGQAAEVLALASPERFRRQLSLASGSI